MIACLLKKKCTLSAAALALASGEEVTPVDVFSASEEEAEKQEVVGTEVASAGAV